jgi:hypothetical protein
LEMDLLCGFQKIGQRADPSLVASVSTSCNQARSRVLMSRLLQWSGTIL